MRDLFFTVLVLTIAVWSFTVPAVASLAYLWVDLVRPQSIAYGVFTSLRVSLTMGILAFLTYAISDGRPIPRLNPLFWMLLFLVVYMTIAQYGWTQFPQYSARFHEEVFKAILFAMFMFFVFRTRRELEAVIFVLVICVAVFTVSVGIKFLMGGLHYGSGAIAISRLSPLKESSNLALYATMTIPFILYVMQNATLFDPKARWFRLAMIGLIFAAVLTTVGTFARTGIVTLAVLCILLILFNKHRVRNIFGFGVVIAVALVLAPASWFDRIATTDDATEDISAYSRLVAWAWSIDYVQRHPLGGGFRTSASNNLAVGGITQIGKPIDQILTEARNLRPIQLRSGRSTHSNYFEILADFGYPGFTVYMSMLLFQIAILIGIWRGCRNDAELDWASSMARFLLMALLIYMAGSAFINITYQSFIYTFTALVGCLSNSVWQTKRQRQKAPTPVRRPAGLLSPAAE